MSSDNPAVKFGKTKTIVLAFASAVFAFAAGSLIDYFLPKFIDIEPAIPARLCRAVLSFIPFCILGGKKWLGFDLKSFGKAWLFCIPLYIANVFLGIDGAIANINDGIPAGVGLRILYFTVLFIIVGINEEIIFRGLIFGGFLRWFGSKKNGVLFAAVISALIFGYGHVMGTIDITNIYSVLTGLFKTLESALFGFVLCYCCIRHKQIWAPIAIHAFTDFTLHLPSTMLTISTSKNYVKTTREAALSSIEMYAFFIVIFIPSVIISFIKLRKAEPTDGPFGQDADGPEPSEA